MFIFHLYLEAQTFTNVAIFGPKYFTSLQMLREEEHEQMEGYFLFHCVVCRADQHLINKQTSLGFGN